MHEDQYYQIRAYDLWAEAGLPDGKHLDFCTTAKEEDRANEFNTSVSLQIPANDSAQANSSVKHHK